MPIYKYQCPKCGEEIQELKRLKDADKVVRCPKCKAEMKRIFGTVRLDFRGDGFTTKMGLK